MTAPTSKRDYFYNYFEDNKDRLLSEYFEFLRFETISAEPACAGHLRACCAWLCRYIEKLGLAAKIWETGGHPLILAGNPPADPAKPTVLLYNHYDVQPVDPLALWKSPPFEPALIGDNIFARGASDNKGQCFFVLSALAAMLARDSSLPVNVKLLIEGEEEYGSSHMYDTLEQKKIDIGADALYIVDAGLRSPDEPAVTLGCRGIITLTIEATGSSIDLHSGEHGGTVYNPNHALVEILAKLRDSSGRITVPGFYDRVRPLSYDEANELCFDFDENQYFEAFGAKPTGREIGFGPLQSAWIRPTVEINGISGGYAGEGFKTVIPAQAIAKVSCRLVPDQCPQEIGSLVADFLRRQTPPGITLKVTVEGGIGKPVRTRTSSKATQAAAQAYAEVFGKPCKYVLTGGSIPISEALAEASGAEIVYLGYGLPEDNAHAPNECFSISRIKQGMATIGRLLEILGA